MGPQAAVDIILRKKISEADDPQSRRIEFANEYRDAHASALYSARKGYIDSILDDNNIRPVLSDTFRLLQEKISALPVRKHSNIQL